MPYNSFISDIDVVYPSTLVLNDFQDHIFLWTKPSLGLGSSFNAHTTPLRNGKRVVSVDEFNEFLEIADYMNFRNNSIR